MNIGEDNHLKQSKLIRYNEEVIESENKSIDSVNASEAIVDEIIESHSSESLVAAPKALFELNICDDIVNRPQIEGKNALIDDSSDSVFDDSDHSFWRTWNEIQSLNKISTQHQRELPEDEVLSISSQSSHSSLSCNTAPIESTNSYCRLFLEKADIPYNEFVERFLALKKSKEDNEREKRCVSSMAAPEDPLGVNNKSDGKTADISGEDYIETKMIESLAKYEGVPKSEIKRWINENLDSESESDEIPIIRKVNKEVRIKANHRHIIDDKEFDLVSTCSSISCRFPYTASDVSHCSEDYNSGFKAAATEQPIELIKINETINWVKKLPTVSRTSSMAALEECEHQMESMSEFCGLGGQQIQTLSSATGKQFNEVKAWIEYISTPELNILTSLITREKLSKWLILFELNDRRVKWKSRHRQKFSLWFALTELKKSDTNQEKCQNSDPLRLSPELKPSEGMPINEWSDELQVKFQSRHGKKFVRWSALLVIKNLQSIQETNVNQKPSKEMPITEEVNEQKVCQKSKHLQKIDDKELDLVNTCSSISCGLSNAASGGSDSRSFDEESNCSQHMFSWSEKTETPDPSTATMAAIYAQELTLTLRSRRSLRFDLNSEKEELMNDS